MATNPTDIANLALSAIGARRIGNIDAEDSPEAAACRLHYSLVRDSLLREYQWNHSTARAALSQRSTPPPAEWDSACQLPSDCVRFIRISGTSQHTPHREFSIEGRTLLTKGLETVEIVYITNSTPVPHWDPLFTKALSLSLAAEIGNDIKSSAAESQAALNKFRNLALRSATNVDAKEVKSGENFGSRQMMQNSSLNRLRRGNR